MENLFIDLLNISITASYIIIAVIIFRLIFKKIPRKFICALWAIAGIRLMLPFSFESVFSLIPSAETIPSDIATSSKPAVSSGIPAVNSIVNPIVEEAFTPKIGESANPLQIIMPICAAVWIVGMLVILAYGIISFVRLKKTVSTAVLLKDNVWQSEKVFSPFILGFVKPKIYIPFGLNGETVNHVVSHENAHLKRKDHWIKPFGFMLLAVYWFNPLVWIAYALLCRDIESACDEKVIAQMNVDARKEYASALLNCAVNRRKIAVCPLAFGEVGVKERIKGVINYKKPAFWIIVFAVIACIIASVCFLTNPATRAPEYKGIGYILKVEVNHYEGTTQLPAKTEKFSIEPYLKNKATISGFTEFKVTQTDLQTGKVTLEFSQDVYHCDRKTETLTVALGESETVWLQGNDTEATFLFEKTQSEEEAISAAILEYNKDKYMKGTFACESHQTLHYSGNEDFDENAGSRTYTFTSYLVASYSEYVCFGGKPESISGGCGPIALTFEYDYNEGKFNLIEYWEAEDGNRYVDSVKEKFSWQAANMALNDDSIAENLNAECDRQAQVYFAGASEKAFAFCDIPTVNVETTFFYDKSKFEYMVYNDGEKDITLDLTNRMFKYENGIWKELDNNQIPIWNLPFDVDEIRIKPGESNTMNCIFDWFEMEGDGHYRFETKIKSHTEHPAVEGTIFIDFSIGDTRIYPEISEEELTTSAVVAGEVNTDETITEGKKTDGSVTYTFENSSEYIKPYINLKNGRFVFFTSVYSSYRCEGEYELKDDKLTLKSDDGRYTYVFNVDGENMVFDAKNSSEPEKFKPSANSEPVPTVQDGDVFVKS